MKTIQFGRPVRGSPSFSGGPSLSCIDLTQAEADALIALEKHRANEQDWDFPMGGELISVPLQSADQRTVACLLPLDR